MKLIEVRPTRMRGDATIEHLTASGAWSARASDGVSFTLTASVRNKHKALVDMAAASLVGGMAAFNVLRRQLRDARTGIVAHLVGQEVAERLEAGVASDDDERRAGQAMLDVISGADDIEIDDHVAVWHHTASTLARVDLIASWKYRVVNPPRGWEDIGERDDDPDVVDAVVRAVASAMREHDAGNAQSSEP